jgi:hypothetical protein
VVYLNLAANTTSYTYPNTLAAGTHYYWEVHARGTSTANNGCWSQRSFTTATSVAPRSRQGVDYSGARPDPAALNAAGYDFVVRYVSNYAWKNITASEATALQNQGIDIILVFEDTADRMLDGYAAGVADANTAVTVATAAGAPQEFFCYFACDFDASTSDQAAINAYLDGAAAALGGVGRVGFYGGYGPLKSVLDAGKAAKGWQTAAWSGGNRDPRVSLFQYAGAVSIAGGSCDIDDGYGNDLGQWSVSAPASPVLWNDAPVWDANIPAGPAVNLHWTASAGTPSALYDLYRDDILVSEHAVNLNQLSYYDKSGLALGQTYTYCIKSHSSAGATQSNTLPVAVPASLGIAAPSVPGDLKATATTSTTVHLTWTPVPDLGASYLIYRSTSSIGPWTLLQSNALQASFDDVYSVRPNSTYYYAIKSTNAGGTSEFSPPASATTPALTKPTAPTIVSAAVQGTNQILVTWTDVLSEGQFILQRATLPNGSYANIQVLNAGTTTYADYLTAPSTASTVYSYRMLSEVDGISSDPSPAIQATVSVPVNNKPVLSADFPTLTPTQFDNVAQLYQFNGSGWTLDNTSALLNEINWTVPTIILTHGWDDSFDPLGQDVSGSFIQQLASNIWSSHSSSFNVLAVDWNDGELGSDPNQVSNPALDIAMTGSGDAVTSANNGKEAARPLANKLLKAGMLPGEVMLVGHSNGAGFLASFAAEVYREERLLFPDRTPMVQELVSLDAPFYTPSYSAVVAAANMIEHVDNYYTPSIQSTAQSLALPDLATFGFGAPMLNTGGKITNFEMDHTFNVLSALGGGSLLSHCEIPLRYAQTVSDSSPWGFAASDFIKGSGNSVYDGTPFWQENYYPGHFTPLNPLGAAIQSFQAGVIDSAAKAGTFLLKRTEDGAILLGNAIAGTATTVYRFGVNNAIAVTNEVIGAANTIEQSITSTVQSLTNVAVSGANYVVSGVNSVVQQSVDTLGNWFGFSAHSPAFASFAINVPQDAAFLDFDLTVMDPGNDDQLLVGIGNDVIGQVDLASVEQTGAEFVQMAIGQYAGASNQTLAFYMPSSVSSTAQFVVGNIRVGFLAVDSAPTVTDVAKELGAGQTLAFSATDFAAGFADPDNSALQMVMITSLPQHGRLTLDGTSVMLNQRITPSLLTALTYTPAPDCIGSDSFGWNGSDGSLYAPAGAAVNLTVQQTQISQATIGLYNPADSWFHLRCSNTTGPADYTFGYGEANGGWIVLTGDWNGDGVTGVGLYAPQSSTFYLSNAHQTGFAEYTFGYGEAGGGWIPLVGDWDGDGKDGVGLYNPKGSTFFLTNTLQTGFAEYTFGYGEPNAGWTPLVGDWNGDGHTGVGLYDPHSSTFYLTDTLQTGYAEHTFGYGEPNAGWQPMVGDWNGDRSDGVGLFAPRSSTFYLTSAFVSGFAQYTFGYGEPNAGWKPLVGDWNGNGASGVGLYAPSSSTFYLTDTLSSGYAEYTVGFGTPNAGWQPLVGCWRATPGSLLPNTPSYIAPTNGSTIPNLTPELIAGSFSDPNTGATHQQSEWQISTSSSFGTTVWDHYDTDSDKTRQQVPSGILNYSTTYYYRVRYEDSLNLWSQWSWAPSFTTPSNPAARAMFAGGFNGSTLSNAVDIYDASTGNWSTASLSQARNYLTATTVGTKAIFAGGQGDSGLSDVADIYDASTGNWSTATLSQARDHLAATTVGTKAMFAGGYSNSGVSNVVDIYDASTGTWSTAALSQARDYLVATAVGTKAVFAGGLADGTLSNVVDIYDASTGNWSTATLSQARSLLAATTAGTKVVFAAGNVGNTASNAVDVYDASTGNWSTATLSQARGWGLAATTVNSSGTGSAIQNVYLSQNQPSGKADDVAIEAADRSKDVAASSISTAATYPVELQSLLSRGLADTGSFDTDVYTNPSGQADESNDINNWPPTYGTPYGMASLTAAPAAANRASTLTSDAFPRASRSLDAKAVDQIDLAAVVARELSVASAASNLETSLRDLSLPIGDSEQAADLALQSL